MTEGCQVVYCIAAGEYRPAMVAKVDSRTGYLGLVVALNGTDDEQFIGGPCSMNRLTAPLSGECTVWVRSSLYDAGSEPDQVGRWYPEKPTSPWIERVAP